MADAVQFLGSPKKAADPDGGVAEPAEKPAVGAYRRRAAEPTEVGRLTDGTAVPPNHRSPERGLAMTTLAEAREFLVELISQLFHADVLITEQADRIDALEAEIDRLRTALANESGAAARAAVPSGTWPRWDRWRTSGGVASRHRPGERVDLFEIELVWPVKGGHPMDQAALQEIDEKELAGRLTTIAAKAFGTVLNLSHLSGGSSRDTWAFDVRLADDRQQPLILQRDRLIMGEICGIGVVTEADVLRAAAKSGVAVPPVLASSADPDMVGGPYLWSSASTGKPSRSAFCGTSSSPRSAPGWPASTARFSVASSRCRWRTFPRSSLDPVKTVACQTGLDPDRATGLLDRLS